MFYSLDNPDLLRDRSLVEGSPGDRVGTGDTWNRWEVRNILGNMDLEATLEEVCVIDDSRCPLSSEKDLGTFLLF